MNIKHMIDREIFEQVIKNNGTKHLDTQQRLECFDNLIYGLCKEVLEFDKRIALLEEQTENKEI